MTEKTSPEFKKTWRVLYVKIILINKSECPEHLKQPKIYQFHIRRNKSCFYLIVEQNHSMATF